MTPEKERGFHCWGCDCSLCKKAREIEGLEDTLDTLRKLARTDGPSHISSNFRIQHWRDLK